MDKTQAYCNLLNLFGRIAHLSKTKPNRHVGAKENLGQEMMMIGMNIALLGSDEVIQDYMNWRVAALSGDTERIIREFSVLMLSMRKDLRDTEITNHKIMTDMFVEVGK